MENINDLDLYKFYMDSPHESHKWSSYFYIYEDLFREFKGKKVTFVEVGVHHGGSLFMWKKYFAKDSRIIGIDLNPNAKKLEEYGFEIFIGDQSDDIFWDNFFKKVGNIDILLDDGSHVYLDQIKTLKSAIPFIKNSGLVVIEDIHTSFMKKFGFKTTKTFTDFIAKLTDNLHKKHPYSELKTNESIYDNIYKITTFESIVAFHINSNFNILNESVMNNNFGIGSTDFRFSNKFIGRLLNLYQKIEDKYYDKKSNFLIKVLLKINYLLIKSTNKIYFTFNIRKINKFFNF